jgi:dienelactone hydrolase
MRTTAPIAAVVVALAVASCGGGSDDATTTSAGNTTTATASPSTPAPPGTTPPPVTTAAAPPGPAGPRAFAEPGPYPVGTVELDLPDVGAVTAWYPGEPGSQAGLSPATYDMRTLLPDADQGKVADADGSVFTMDAFTGLTPATPTEPFPLVLFSHGLCGYRQQSSFLATAVASWGFVVAAPEHTARDLTACLTETTGQGPADVDQLVALVPAMEAQNLSDTSPLAGLIDTDRVAVTGHSAGGGAAIRMSDEEVVDAYVALAAGGGEDDAAPPAKPSLYVAGDADAIVPLDRVQAWYATVPAPKRLAVLGGVTHLGFMDICTLGQDRGGVLQIATDAGVAVPEVILRLFADGCAEQYTAAEDAWPVIRHLTIAHLRSALGIDAAPVGLDPVALAGAYPGVPVTVSEG